MGLLTPFGMEMEAVGAEIGASSSIKMFRSVMVKGWEALVVEALSAAELAGVSERVLASLSESYPGLDWPKLASYHISRVALHGKRRAAEMRKVVATLEDLGVEPLMATATAERMDCAVDSGVRECFPDGPPEDSNVLVAATRNSN